MPYHHIDTSVPTRRPVTEGIPSLWMTFMESMY
jgi:hypothetical protein